MELRAAMINFRGRDLFYETFAIQKPIRFVTSFSFFSLGYNKIILRSIE